MELIDNDPVGTALKKPRTAAMLRVNQSLRNAKARINAADKKWHPKEGPAIAKLIREGAAAANIDAKVAALEAKAAKEEKKAVKAVVASASAAKAGDAVKSAEKAAEAAGAAASASVLKAAANAGTAKKPLTAAQAKHHQLLRNAAASIKTAKKKYSPTRAKKIYNALKAGNNAGAKAVLNTMANAANEKAAVVGAAAVNGAAGASKGNAWKANIARAKEQIKRNIGPNAAQLKYSLQLASALRKGNDVSVAAAMNKIRANLGTRNAKKAAKKPAGNNKTKKNAATSPFKFSQNNLGPYTENNNNFRYF